jgi:hypothetical protein
MDSLQFDISAQKLAHHPEIIKNCVRKMQIIYWQAEELPAYHKGLCSMR